MEQYTWDGPIDSDEEVAEAIPLKNEYEKQLGIKFSKRGLVEFIENFISTEDPATNTDWEKKTTTPSFTFSMKEGGSQFNKDMPVVRTDQFYNKRFTIDKLITVAYNPKYTLKWDKNLKVLEETPIFEGKKSFIKVYTENKKQFTFAGRDFCEKTFSFYNNGKLYRYSTSIDGTELAGPDGEEAVKASPKNVLRCFVIYSCAIIERQPDEQIKLTHVCQIDWKAKVPAMIMNKVFPTAAKDWHANVIKFYTKN